MANSSAPSKHPLVCTSFFSPRCGSDSGSTLMLGFIVLYMIGPVLDDKNKSGLGLDQATANDVYGTYIALVYLTPFVVDCWLTVSSAIAKRLSLAARCWRPGYFCLLVPSAQAFYAALALIIVGNGLFKPNISTLLGNLYNQPEYSHLKDKGYNKSSTWASTLVPLSATLSQLSAKSIRLGLCICIGWRRHDDWLDHLHSAKQQGGAADVVRPAKTEDMPLSKIAIR